MQATRACPFVGVGGVSPSHGVGARQPGPCSRNSSLLLSPGSALWVVAAARQGSFRTRQERLVRDDERDLILDVVEKASQDVVTAVRVDQSVEARL